MPFGRMFGGGGPQGLAALFGGPSSPLQGGAQGGGLQSIADLVRFPIGKPLPIPNPGFSPGPPPNIMNPGQTPGMGSGLETMIRRLLPRPQMPGLASLFGGGGFRGFGGGGFGGQAQPGLAGAMGVLGGPLAGLMGNVGMQGGPGGTTGTSGALNALALILGGQP